MKFKNIVKYDFSNFWGWGLNRGLRLQTSSPHKRHKNFVFATLCDKEYIVRVLYI